MADSYVLYGPGGASPLQLQTFVLADPGPDFNSEALLQSDVFSHPNDGAALSSETNAVRKFKYPLRVASGALGALTVVESILRDNARPGGYIDIQPDGVASTEAIRFDILAGRWLPQFQPRVNPLARRTGTLELDVKPLGYWATWIILASAASVGIPAGQLAIVPSAVIGDAPALVRLRIAPTVASYYPPSATWVTDMAAFSLSAKASFTPLWMAASLASGITGTRVGDAFAVGSQAIRVFPQASARTGFEMVAFAQIPSALEPAYRGLYRTFAWVHAGPSTAETWQVTMDAAPRADAPMASIQPWATAIPAVASGVGGFGKWGALPSPAYQLLDTGVLALPPVPSGLQQPFFVRLWADHAASDTGVPTPNLKIAGIYLLPIDEAGIMPRGLTTPSLPNGTAGAFHLDSAARRGVVQTLDSTTAAPVANSDALGYYRGAMPKLGPSVSLLQTLVGHRSAGSVGIGSYAGLVASTLPKAYYRMEETVGPTMIDFMGSWHGTWITTPSLGAIGAVDYAARFDSDSGKIPSILGANATSWSVMLWARRDVDGATHALLGQGRMSGSQQGLRLAFTADNGVFFDFRDSLAANQLTAAGPVSADGTYHHLGFTWDYASRTKAIWIDGQLGASQTAVTTFLASGPISVGAAFSEFGDLKGRMDELVFYHGTAVGSDVVQPQYAAGLASYGLPRIADPVAHAGSGFAQASIEYRPRFQFLKGV